MANTVQSQIQDIISQAANQILNQRRALSELLRNGRTFTDFDPVDDVTQNQKQTITQALWTDGSRLSTFFTSSDQTAYQKRWYYQVMQTSSDQVASEQQFTIAWGHYYGSGSDTGSSGVQDYPTKGIYHQYKQLLLTSETLFTFKDGTGSDQIYVINVNRGRFKEKIQPGTVELWLSPLNGAIYTGSANSFTGSSVVPSASATAICLIDDSSVSSSANIGDSGRVYNMVSGSISGGVYSTDTGSWGMFYPDYGLIVLNGKFLDSQLKFKSITGSGINGDNAWRLFTSISGAAAYTSSYGFNGSSAETVSSTYYYVRIKNGEYNFSTNPSFVTGSNGDLRQSTFLGDPKTYITSVGLYNDANELLAVAKLNKAVLKAFDREVLIKVRLDY